MQYQPDSITETNMLLLQQQFIQYIQGTAMTHIFGQDSILYILTGGCFQIYQCYMQL